MIRVRFEPIDVRDGDDFQVVYEKLRKMINGTYTEKFNELMPSIRKMYAVDEMGFPLDPTLDNS
jgi:hypothetical protein